MSIGEIDREQLLQAFLAESQELLAEMESALLLLEQSPDELESIQAAFRAAHTIKGNAWFLELTEITEMAHSAEDVLDCVKEGKLEITSDLVTVLLQTVDALRAQLSVAVDGGDASDEMHQSLLRQLLECVPEEERSIAPTFGDLDDDLDASDAAVTSQPEGDLDLIVVEDAVADVESRAPAEAPSPAVRAAGDSVGQSVDRTRTLRVDVARLDRIMNLVGEITISRGRLSRALEKKTGSSRVQALEAHRESDQLYVDLQEMVMRVRMVPLGPLLNRFNRAVRDLSEAVGHQARLEVSGEDVEVDMTVIEHLADPLMHLVRNAIHHGIESPEVRRALGKPSTGIISLSARHDAGYIVIEITDDGAGIDRDRLRERAFATGLHRRPETLSETELLALIFEPGFTTATEVSDLSGRGVGMDVVRRRIQSLRGVVTVVSEPGKGTRISLRLPLTLAILDGLSVTVCGESYILPLEYVTECVELAEVDRRRQDGEGVLKLRERPLPYLYLRSFFDLPEDGNQRESVVVLRHHDNEIGLAVDYLNGEVQAVIKPLNKMFRHLPALLGTTLLDDGSIAFVLDVPSLVERTVNDSQSGITSTGHGV